MGGSLSIESSELKGGGKGKWGVEVRVVGVSLFIVLICQSTLVSLSPPSPTVSPPSAPGVCVADKREAEEAVGSRHDAVCLGRLPWRARNQVKGP